MSLALPYRLGQSDGRLRVTGGRPVLFSHASGNAVPKGSDEQEEHADQDGGLGLGFEGGLGGVRVGPADMGGEGGGVLNAPLLYRRGAANSLDAGVAPGRPVLQAVPEPRCAVPSANLLHCMALLTGKRLEQAR